MPINKENTRFFHRTLYGTILQTITLLKRNDDQQEGTVTPYTIYEVRPGKLNKTGQAIDLDMSAGDRQWWHIPMAELERVGITHINVLDRIVDKFGRVWEPEASTEVRYQLIENHCCISCRRLKAGSR